MAKDRDFDDDYFNDEPVVEEVVEEPEPVVAAPEPSSGPVFDRGEDGKIHDVS